jgi:hypothetical protein
VNARTARSRSLSVMAGEAVAWLATVEGGLPCVRMVTPIRTECFTVRLGETLAAGEKVELCYLGAARDQVRITGTIRSNTRGQGCELVPESVRYKRFWGRRYWDAEL